MKKKLIRFSAITLLIFLLLAAAGTLLFLFWTRGMGGMRHRGFGLAALRVLESGLVLHARGFYNRSRRMGFGNVGHYSVFYAICQTQNETDG